VRRQRGKLSARFIDRIRLKPDEGGGSEQKYLHYWYSTFRGIPRKNGVQYYDKWGTRQREGMMNDEAFHMENRVARMDECTEK